MLFYTVVKGILKWLAKPLLCPRCEVQIPWRVAFVAELSQIVVYRSWSWLMVDAPEKLHWQIAKKTDILIMVYYPFTFIDS